MTKTQVPICSFCDKELCLEEGVQAYFKVSQEFEALMIDHNTGMVEEIPTLLRKTHSFVCPECFDIYVDHMEQLLAKFPKYLSQRAQPSVRKSGSDLTEDATSAFIAKKNFKALAGSVRANEERIAPPKDDQDKPGEVAN